MLSGFSGPSRGVFNAAHFGNHVSKAIHWTDGGSEFVFMDGTVMSFSDHMNTFVAVNPSASPTQRDLMLTSLCLSTYEEKVRAALAVYNRFSAKPRLVHGLCHTQECIWQKASPIEALVLSTDSSLFSREYITTPMPTNAAISGQSVVLGDSVPAHCTLWCAMRKVRLTVHASRKGFQVSWPAKVSETDGSTTVFVPPMNEHGEYIHALASQRACRYVMLEQWFWLDQCPQEWAEMVRLCLELHRTVPHGRSSEEQQDNHQSSSISLTTPTPLGAPRLPGSASSYLAERSVTAYGTSLHSLQHHARFSELQVDDAHSFIASTQIQSSPAQTKLHPPLHNAGGAAPAQVVWRWDSDPSGRSPSSFFHCWKRDGGSACCAAFVLEDDAIITGEANRVPSGGAPNVVRLHLDRIVLEQNAPGTSASSTVVPLQGVAACVESRGYIQDAALSLALPKTINNGLAIPALGSLGSAVMRQLVEAASSPSSVSSTVLEYGRYLPSIAESIVSLLARFQLGTAPPPLSSASLSSSTMPHDATLEHAEPRAVKFTTRMDGVGTFTALTNGVCRAVFDDRVIVTLIPDQTDSDEGLVCEMRGRDGELRALRVSQAVSTHPVFDYLAYLLPFRNFARMSEADQRALALVMPPPQQHYERTPIFADSAVASGVQQQQQHHHYSSTTTTNHSTAVRTAESYSSTLATTAGVSSVDLMMLNTSGSLSHNEVARARARRLLHDLA